VGQEIFVITAAIQTPFRQANLIDNRNILDGDLRPGEKQKADRFLLRFFLDKSEVCIYNKFMPEDTGNCQRYAVVLQQPVRFPDSLRFRQKM